jgi:NADH dehydrogenase
MNTPAAKSGGNSSRSLSENIPPRVVIVGGGFGGLAAARALKNVPVQVVLIDRANHHLFQPLLYQVATSLLSPAQIASPIRNILRKQKNTAVVLGEVTGVDRINRRVTFDDPEQRSVALDYDYLILATGAKQSYFGHPEFEAHALGLKTLADAVLVRDHVLRTFEAAEAESDPSKHPELLTFVLIGGGPTGVEMAGAIAFLARTTVKSEFRKIDLSLIRIILVDAGPRVLATFPEKLSEAALRRLQTLGVEVRLGIRAELIDAEGVVFGGERIRSRTVIWTAGVSPSPAGRWLGAETDPAGRVRILPDLTIPNSPEVFVIGDTASLEEGGKPLPGVAQVALQQGRFAASCIDAHVSGEPARPPFRYFDKGSIAVVGKGFAVFQTRGLRISGFLAWLVWVAVHLQFLAQTNLRVSVCLQWIWTYVTGKRGSRIIVSPFSVVPRVIGKNETSQI